MPNMIEQKEPSDFVDRWNGQPKPHVLSQQEKEAIFVREHKGHCGPSVWGPMGKPGPAGKGPL